MTLPTRVSFMKGFFILFILFLLSFFPAKNKSTKNSPILPFRLFFCTTFLSLSLLFTHTPDGDGIPDYLDPDSDNDGIPDATEQKGAVAKVPGGGRLRRLPQDMMSLDSDGDGLPNYLDVDSDGDGISDFIEKGPADCCLGNGQGGVGQPVDTGAYCCPFLSSSFYLIFLLFTFFYR